MIAAQLSINDKQRYLKALENEKLKGNDYYFSFEHGIISLDDEIENTKHLIELHYETNNKPKT